MILKSVEMQGFKSFADKIYLDFNSGITAIVGPNGSGKSNISDAIRWVMGEQSIKSLRGSRMEDVIFAGTESRKALGFAEVTLNLDNESGIFDIDFPEIRVSRRLYRSGESEYYINKTMCRLKDVHELFMDTGLGRDGYSIIGQGQIENILSSKSEDRRYIFEEASGISKYKYRKNEAERKLARTEENLTRVVDILGELEDRLEPLRRQSEKAKQYLVLRDEMKELEINVSVINIERKRSALKKLKEDIDIYDSQIQSIQGQIDSSDKKVEAMYAAADEIDSRIEDCRESERELLNTVHVTANKISLAESEISHAEDSIDRLNSEISGADDESKNLDKQLGELKDKLGALRSQSSAIEESAAELSEKSEKSVADVSEESRALEDLRAEISECAAKAGSIRSMIESKRILLDDIASRNDIISKELESKNTDIEEMNSRLNALDDEIRNGEADIEKLRAETNRLDELYGEKNAEMQKAISDKNKKNMELGQLSSRKKMLEEMERDLEGYGRGVKSVMNAYNKKMLPGTAVHGPLSQLIKTDKKYITAIETALGNASQNIVTDNSEDAKAAIRYLKDRKLGRATFLPISDIKERSFDTSKPEKLKGYIGTADSLVECNQIYRAIVSSVLGAIVIVDNIDNAVAMGKKCGHKFRIVTLGGDVVQPGGAITGGSAQKSLGTLSRTNEINELGGKISAAEKAIVAATKNINSLSIEVSGLLDNVRNNEQTLSSRNEELIRRKSERGHLSEIITSGGADREKMQAEIRDLGTRSQSLIDEIGKSAIEAEKLDDTAAELTKAAEMREKSFLKITGENEKLSRAILDLTIRRNSVLKDIEQINERIQRLNDEKSRLISSSADKLGEINELKKHIEAVRLDIKNNEQQSERNKTALKNLKSELEELAEKRRETEAKIKAQQESVGGVRDSLINISKLHAKAQSKYESSDAELETIIDYLWEEYRLTYSDAQKDRDLSGFDFGEASKRITSLKRQIKGLGNINIDAVEEYKSVKERSDFLREQVDDLNKSKKELGKVITEMLSIMKTQFSDRFKSINENFSRVFSELFGGGKAKLSLTDPDNVLESGIEIEAQPPGKKLQNLSLLSGGEKALSAIALLFAILNVRPTPFCILDEIEAALDDVNVYRFAEYLKRYSEKTQFIVVTHKRGTMEAADILYGVTMQEKGVSKLLTLNMDEVSE